jgi:hypothetical protein
LTDDLLKLFVENRVRIFDGLEEFVKNDITPPLAIFKSSQSAAKSC